jgi:hypothetical protein
MLCPLPGEVPASIREHFDTSRPKLYCAMGVSGSPRVLREVIEIVNNLEIQSLIVTTTILPEREGNDSGRVLLTPHVPAHRVNPLADIAITHGGAGTVQTAIHAGTPLVGIPMHLEQTGNLSLVTRQGAGTDALQVGPQPALAGPRPGNLLRMPACARTCCGSRTKALQDKVDGPAIAAREIVAAAFSVRRRGWFKPGRS